MTHDKNSVPSEVKKVHVGQQSFSCSNFYEKGRTKLKIVKNFYLLNLESLKYQVGSKIPSNQCEL